MKKIDKIIEKKLDKPFKKDLKQIKKTEKEIINREKNIDKRVEQSTQGIRKARYIIEENTSFVSGAVGETAAIRELKKLPETYFIINEAMLSFSRAIRWRKYYGYVKSCKIDHVVVGPTGIFLIETKNWNPQRIKNTDFTPHMQIDRAGYIFFIHMMDFFNRKFPVYKIVATYRKLPEIDYDYVEQMTIRELVNFILRKKEKLASHNILKIVKWLKTNPHINNYKFRTRWFF
ncbi:MAG: NERD domain-containing protein [Promethearchaeota archaeon]|nr:MAG: NERD domain-containing protein [Candidatus Lokiarchaeota archaeon]